MVYISDIQELVSKWTERMGNPAHPSDYRTALSECIYELSGLANRAIDEEFDYESMLASMEHDDYPLTLISNEAA